MAHLTPLNDVVQLDVVHLTELHSTDPEAPLTNADNSDTRTSCEYARRYYCVLANLLVETGRAAA